MVISSPGKGHRPLSTSPPRLDSLPDDVLGIIFGHLGIDELVNLRLVGRGLSDRVLHLGLPRYLSSHRQSHLTLHPSSFAWSPYQLVQHNHLINRSLTQHEWHALQIGSTWIQPVIPTLHLTSDRLILGVGGKLLSHPLYPPRSTISSHGGRGKVVGKAREFPISPRGVGSRADIVGVVDLHDNQGSLAVAQFNGTIQRLSLPEAGPSIPRITARYSHPRGKESIHTVTGSEGGQMMMTTTSSGSAYLYTNTRSPWTEPSSIKLSSNRAWSSLLVSSHPTLSPTAMIGVQGSIEFHDILPTGLQQTVSRRILGPDLPLTSSPYDIHLPPLDGSSSHHPSLLLSAWYDSHLRLHDLRTPSTTPVGVFMDPYTWADGSAFYSTCFVGEHHIAGGGSRHGTVAFFDIRNSKKGWSCFSPGGKGSPVYSLRGEGGKVWGVTERRAFVLAFDGSGDVEDGLVLPEARNVGLGAGGVRNGRDRDRGRHVPSGWKGRGGKWAWTVRYDEEEGSKAVGYEHRERGVTLFDSLAVA
ncbi:hypothetical protein CI109_100145 [Kwoniella shandongensis]|uniref:Uncharacterized protein n=1 Tax=Kwoniella shandongensis TaxID=1734106 RepID=A0A5M6BV53_9TREE|nr:uncharacterized protein CI109_005743 [Kwoniella shandongensis]KAA5525862.1 hypothetical protein CI109_005743 [Kwoniella shandongensis]